MNITEIADGQYSVEIDGTYYVTTQAKNFSNINDATNKIAELTNVESGAFVDIDYYTSVLDEEEGFIRYDGDQILHIRNDEYYYSTSEELTTLKTKAENDYSSSTASKALEQAKLDVYNEIANTIGFDDIFLQIISQTADTSTLDELTPDDREAAMFYSHGRHVGELFTGSYGLTSRGRDLYAVNPEIDDGTERAMEIVVNVCMKNGIWYDAEADLFKPKIS